jgi:hypothetical protein
MHSNTDTQQRNPGRLPFDMRSLVPGRIIGLRPGGIQHPLSRFLLGALQLFNPAPVHTACPLEGRDKMPARRRKARGSGQMSLLRG